MPARRSLAVALALALGLGLGLAATATAAPAPEATRVMFVGDSITGSPGCWRAPLWVALSNAGYPVDAVGINTVNECGDLADAAGDPWDPDNTGIGGVTATRMWIKLARDKVLEEHQPQVIVQLLGTNDLLGGSSAEEILAEYHQLLELYRNYDPGIRVVVGTPPPLDSGVCGCDAAQAELASALPGWAAGASTPESPVMVADLSTGFDPATDTDDGIHPNESGNAKLAAAWLPVIEGALDAAPASESPAPEIPADREAPEPSGGSWPLLALVAVVIAAGVGVAVRRRS